MGAGLAALAMARPGLSPTARLVLTRMALTAHDTDLEPVYWAGWEFLATQGLGYRTYTPAAKLAVARATAELQAADCLKVRRSGRPGNRAEYVLTLH